MRPTRGAVQAPAVGVVADEVIAGEAVAMYLTSCGYRTRVFQNPVLAYASFVFARRKPDLLIADCAAGEMNGIELARKCKEACPRLRTILIGAWITEEMLETARLQPDALLGKPFSFSELTAQVERLIGPGAGIQPGAR